MSATSPALPNGLVWPTDQHLLNESDSGLISRSSEPSTAEKTIAESDLCVRYGSVPLITG